MKKTSDPDCRAPVFMAFAMTGMAEANTKKKSIRGRRYPDRRIEPVHGGERRRLELWPLEGVDGARGLLHAARRLAALCSEEDALFAEVRQFADAALDLLPRRLCHPCHQLCEATRAAGVARLHQASPAECARSCYRWCRSTA
jgi:hypothetical protein